MEALTDVKALADLGLSAILLFMVFTLWKDRKESQKLTRQALKDKDDNLAEVNKEVLEVVKENTKTQVELRATIKEHITLTEKLYEAFKQK